MLTVQLRRNRLDMLPAKPEQWTVKEYGCLPRKDMNIDVSQHGVYLDESGGQWAKDPRLARAGWGLALIDIHNRGPGMPPATSLRGGIAGNVPGEFQTPPRACLNAFIYALQ